jgi:hypothetical protein
MTGTQFVAASFLIVLAVVGAWAWIEDAKTNRKLRTMKREADERKNAPAGNRLDEERPRRPGFLP